jgi:transcriptional regulator with GAF, ATPase, and Fis domain
MNLSQASRLAEMALDMTEQPDVQRTLDRVASHAHSSLGGTAAGVVLLTDDRVLEPAASTDRLARQADLLQLTVGVGPGLFESGGEHVRVVDDTRTDSRWPHWGAEVASLGWHSVLSVRLCTPTRTLGALTVYADETAAFGPEAVDLAGVFGRHASIALMGAQSAQSLRAAVKSRHVIGQAQGILMQRYQVDADRAFTVLRRYSQDKNVKLRLVAEHVIAHHQLPD